MLFKIVSIQQSERERMQREYEKYGHLFWEVMDDLKKRWPRRGSCCIPMDIEDLFNIDDVTDHDDDDDYSHLFEGLNLEVTL